MPEPSSHSSATVDSCNDCGACCLHMGFPSFITGSDSQPAEKHWLSMPENLRRDLLGYIAAYSPPPSGQLDGVCCWFDQESRTCKHHQHRPNVCRDFEVGSEDCLGWRKVYGITSI